MPVVHTSSREGLWPPIYGPPTDGPQCPHLWRRQSDERQPGAGVISSGTGPTRRPAAALPSRGRSTTVRRSTRWSPAAIVTTRCNSIRKMLEPGVGAVWARLDRTMNLELCAVMARFSVRRHRQRGWREVAAAWMVMLVVVSGLTAWISLRVPRDPPQNLVRISRPTAAETCSERDYANERC